MLRHALRQGLQTLVNALGPRRADLPVSVQRAPLPFAVTPEDIGSFRDRMYAYWGSLGHPPATCEMFLRDAFNTDGYVDAVMRALRVMGDLHGKKILDVGCGWGGLSRVLTQCGAQVTMVDPHPPHVEIARARVPGATGMIGSGTDLVAAGLTDRMFDHVFVYSVIEHVDMPPDHRGDACQVLETQQKVICEAARVLKPGGLLMVSTGNYLFPYDGEVQIWFFHYLPKELQQLLLQVTGRSADRYGLLTWAQLHGMTQSAGLTLAHVETCEMDDLLRTMEGWIVPLCVPGTDSSRSLSTMEKIREKISKDPNWMHMWYAFFRKPV
jgi:2-polyprenyl-3-methyl-5-hydroxy-6-metoxy-1,4-benzoquinol methylase